MMSAAVKVSPKRYGPVAPNFSRVSVKMASMRAMSARLSGVWPRPA
jgi:hypothetical protein